ncbi:immunoglobulin-like domain-containing protein [Sulfurimonas sp.]|uniref:NHL domain-containing protein n=3 Tax=Sulfurimonas sp. TaxID=2022749 RepID=UPI003D0F2A11
MKKILAILLLLSLGSLAFAKEHKSEHKEFHHKKEIGYTLSPLPNATNVAADTKIKVIFDEKVERKTLKHSHIVLKYVEKHHKKAKHKKIKPIKGQSYFSRAENALIFLPHHELQEGEYEVSIDGIGHKPIRYTFSVSAIQDTTPPTITLNGSDTITLNRKQSYIEYGATATDDVDGNLSVSITNNVDTNTTGTYQVIYSAKDSAGNEATATRSVEVLPLLNSLTLSSEVTTLHIGDTSTLSVSGTYEDGFTKDLTQTVNYNVADTTIGIMNENIFEALNVGTTTLSVNYAGVSSNSITISVIEPIDTTNFNATYFGSQYLQYIPKDATVTKYDEDLFCMLTGKILVEDGTGLAGVKVTVLNHPEYGSQVTDANGSYVFATKGGVTLTMRYQKDGYTTIDRKVEAPIQEWGIAPEVTMLPIDSKVTTINLESLTPQLHVSTPITDDRGTRSTTLVFNGVTQAIITAKDGTTRELQSIDVRATEFKTPTSMPSDLPSTSAYTYCSDLTVDGVSDDENVTFNAPVIMYVENFLGFDVGEIVPVGYYDRNKGKWIGSENGAVVKLLDTDGDGKVDAVDSTGDDQPNDLDGDGLYSDEVVGLQDNSNYQAGLTYWRAAITHFTPWDHNWPYGPPDDADKPDDPDIDDDNPDDPCKVSLSSYVEPKKRIFHEDIPIAGTNETLHYSSKSVDGYTYVIDASVDTTTAPSSAIGATATLKVGGRTFVKQVSLNQLNTLKFKWDGYDVSGHKMSGDVKAIITIAYQYQPVYYASNTTFSQAWAKVGSTVTAIRGRSTIDLQTKKTVIINVENTNSYSGHLANGWMFSDDFYQLDKLKNKEFTYTISTVTGNGARGFSGDYRYATNAALFFPQGIAVNQAGELFIADTDNNRIRKVDTNGIITTVAGNGAQGFSGDYRYATNAALSYPHGIAINQAGELFIADTDNNRIRKVDTNGIITTVAGNGSYGFSGDNGDATNASLLEPRAIAINQAGELFIADVGNNRIRKVDTNGIITTVAGNGTQGFSGDGGDATNASLYYPHGIAINQAGELFIASSNSRIRKVDTNGIITTVAGNGARGFSGDGGDATNASLLEPRAIAINQVGELFIADTYNNRIRKVDTNGIITTVAGNGARGFSGDNGDATNTSLFFPQGIAINQAGELFIADTINDRIRKLIPSKIHQKYNLDTSKYIYKNPDNTIEIYDSTGKHLKTFDLETEKTLKEYTYDSNGYLSTITDQFGNTLSITRDANGYPTEITAPNGQKAYLQVDDNGDLIDVWYEDNSGYNFTYFDGSLMDTMTDRNGNKILHIYDENGRITQETDAAGGTWQFAKSGTPKAPVYSMTKPEGSVTSGVNEKQDDGSIIATRTLPTGDTLTITTSADEKTQTTQSNGITTTVNYTADSFTQDKILSSSTTTQPSGLSQTTTYVTKYDGNTTQTNVKTKKVTSNGKTTISKTDYTTGEITFTTPESRVLTTLYNKENRLTTSIQSGTLTPTTYEYDTKGRVVSETTGDRVVSYTYDQRGNIATITTPNNETTNYEYDVMDKVTKITYPNGNTELYAYDANGNMTRLSTPTPTDFTFTYNGVDKRTSLISPSNYTTSYTYNKNRKLTSITRPSGATITNNYTNDRLSSTVTPEGTINYNYLFADQLSSISMGSESIEYSYDGDLLTSLTQNGTLDQSINYTYNNDFAVTSTSYAGVTTTYSYDNDGLLTQSGDFTLTRDPDNGYVTNVTDGTLSIDKEYNNYAELTQHSDNTLSYTLQRNLEGNIIQKIETVGGTINTYNYTYDENSRLITVEKNNQIVESYTYDKNSNRISATINGVTTQATYDQEDAIDTYGDNTYTYDTDGQLNQKITNEGITTYSYNSQGTLTKVVTPTNTIEYILNPLGQRVAKKVDGTITEKYLWADLTTLLATLDANNNIIQRYNYTDSRVPTSMQQDGETYYLHYDQVGTLKAISDTNHNIVKEITYDTYGNIQNDTNPNFQIPFGFAGGLQDQDTQLVHFGYRELDTYTGKWTTKDPIDFSGGDSNLYGYVLQDPVNLVDPKGLKTFSNPNICVAVAAGSSLKSIDNCNDLVMDAYNDYLNMKNDDYLKMCGNFQPTGCAIGCLGNDFYQKLKEACTPDLRDLKKLQLK